MKVTCQMVEYTLRAMVKAKDTLKVVQSDLGDTTYLDELEDALDNLEEGIKRLSNITVEIEKE